MRTRITLFIAALGLFLLGGHLSYERAWPFRGLWSLRERFYQQWQEHLLLQRLQRLGYDVVEGQFDGRPDPALLRVAARADAPLLIDLHPWNSDWLELREPLFERAAALDWHVLRPNFGGWVRDSGHCCSDAVIASIDHAIALARARGVAAEVPLWVVGESGGGMTAACWLARGGHRPARVQLWVPVTDLPAWRRQNARSRPDFVQDIQQCTAQGSQAAALSPVNLDFDHERLRDTRVDIFAGIHDGFAGPVPVSHSVDLYNRLAAELSTDANPASTVEATVLAGLLREREGDGAAYELLAATRTVHLRRSTHKLSLTIFEGGHEMLVDAAIETFCEDANLECMDAAR